MNSTKSFTSILIVLLLIFLASCSKLRKSWTKEGYVGKSFPRLAIVVINPDPVERKSFQDLVISSFAASEIQVVTDAVLFIYEEVSDSVIDRRVADLRLDGILTVGLITSDENQFISPENYNKFSKFYSHRFTGLNTPQYLAKSSTYVMEGVLHDLTEVHEIVWRGEMALLDPKNASAKKRFLNRMTKELVEEGLIKSTKSPRSSS